MKEEDPNKTWWAPAFEIASLISVWIVAPVVSALIIGKWLDSYFKTTPIIFLSLACISFLISMFGIAKTVTKYIAEIEKLKKQNDSSVEPK